MTTCEVCGRQMGSARGKCNAHIDAMERFRCCRRGYLRERKRADAAEARGINFTREELRAAIADALEGNVYVCTRVWSAWAYGTMGEDDFRPASKDDDAVDSITEAVIALMAKKEPAP